MCYGCLCCHNFWNVKSSDKTLTSRQYHILSIIKAIWLIRWYSSSSGDEGTWPIILEDSKRTVSLSKKTRDVTTLNSIAVRMATFKLVWCLAKGNTCQTCLYHKKEPKIIWKVVRLSKIFPNWAVKTPQVGKRKNLPKNLPSLGVEPSATAICTNWEAEMLPIHQDGLVILCYLIPYRKLYLAPHDRWTILKWIRMLVFWMRKVAVIRRRMPEKRSC